MATASPWKPSARAWTWPTVAFYDHLGRLFPDPEPKDPSADEEPATVFGEQLVLL
jgi:hypothetical protein